MGPVVRVNPTPTSSVVFIDVNLLYFCALVKKRETRMTTPPPKTMLILETRAVTREYEEKTKGMDRSTDRW